MGVERSHEDLRSETYKILGETQKTFEGRLLEEKLNIELNMETKYKGTTDKINKLEAEQLKDV